jgi:membrane-associated protease RseP (regulator of RpoE activity)
MSLSESLTGDLSESIQPRPSSAEHDIGDNIVRQLTEALDGLMSVQAVQNAQIGGQPRGARANFVFEGTLLGDAEALYPVIQERFKSLGYTPMLQRSGDTDMLVAVEGLLVARRFSSPGWLHALLLFVTILTTTISGAQFQGYSLDIIIREVFTRHHTDYLWTVFRAGAPFALTLLLILGVHEMGHYVAARRHGVDVTLPYFIPLPIGILGTLGAVIFIKSALTNRKALFDVGISGPLAGFVVALVAFVISLTMKPVGTNIVFYEAFGGPGSHFVGLGMPLLLQWIGNVVRPGRDLGLFVTQQPVALAAWFGMLLTVLNLLPIGQLDGGHVMYTLFGRFAWTIALLAFTGLIFLGLTVFPSFLFFGFLALLTGLRHPPPGNDITPLDWKRRALGYATLVLFVLILTLNPFVVRYR